MDARPDLRPMDLQLPPRWRCTHPTATDVPELADLLRRHEQRATGGSYTAEGDVRAAVTGDGAQTREHLLLRDGEGVARAWGSVHDRAAGRVLTEVTVDPDLDERTADEVAGALFGWAVRHALRIGTERGLTTTQLDSGSFAGDERQHRWLRAAGCDRVRSWWQMSRPVTAEEGKPGALPGPRDGVRLRLVGQGADGMPDEADLRTVHDVLEGAFADHFNSYAETFEEFVARLRADPGHRWDHWWIAELVDAPGEPVPAGALVGTVTQGRDGAPDGSYVAYVGVLEAARGRGVGKALIHAVIADAARRGRNRVGLEVDADSPTGAERLYTSMGFRTYVTTESWHRDLPVPAAASGGART